MGKIGENPKFGQIWRHVAPQPYVVQKSRPTSETPWPLAVYLCSASRDLYPALTEVPVWQIVDFRFWGQMTPKVKIFEKVFRSHRRDTEIRFVAKFVKNWPLRSCRQVVSITTQKKNLHSAGLIPAPILSKMDRLRPKSRPLSHLEISTYTKFGPDRLRFAELILERLIFWPKKSIQYTLSAYNKKTLHNFAADCLPK